MPKPGKGSQKTARQERMKTSTTSMTLKNPKSKYITNFVLVQQDDKQYTWIAQIYFFKSFFNCSHSSLYLNNRPFLSLESCKFSSLTRKVTLASRRLRFEHRHQPLNITFWPSNLSRNIQYLDISYYLEMNSSDVTNVFHHLAEVHAMNQRQHKRCSVALSCTQHCFTE